MTLLAWRTRARALLHRALAPLDWPRSRRELLAALPQATTPEALWQLTQTYRGYGLYRGLQANQHPDEIIALFRRIQALEPRVIVEIGTRDGATLLFWSQAGRSLQTLISIDLPGGIHGGGYVTEREALYRLFVHNQPQCTLHLLRRDSQLASTRDQVKALIGAQPIDALFIDGDHRYAGVRADYELYRDLVRPGGLIAFHDIYPNTRDASFGVHRLWDEIRREQTQISEIAHQPYTGRYGIGVVTLPG